MLTGLWFSSRSSWTIRDVTPICCCPEMSMMSREASAQQTEITKRTTAGNSIERYVEINLEFFVAGVIDCDNVRSIYLQIVRQLRHKQYDNNEPRKQRN